MTFSISVTAEQSTAAMIGLIVGCVFVCLLLSGFSVACFIMRRNRRNTKLVGVMGNGMTPKSMSVGLGLNGNCPPSSDQLSTNHTTNKTPLGKKSSGSSTSSSVTLSGGGKKFGKIALCDMNPVSISGETDSDESLYHELVFGRNGPSVIIAKNSSGSANGNVICGSSTTKSRKNSGGLNGYNPMINNGSSVGSSCTSTGKTESDSGYGSSSQQLVRKHCGLVGTKKIKYQKVNHGADFSGELVDYCFLIAIFTQTEQVHILNYSLDVMTMRGMDEEMAYFHTHNQNLGQFQPSSPASNTGLRCSTNKLPLLGQSLGSIPYSSSPSGSMSHGPSSPVPSFRIPFLPHHPHQQIQFTSNHNPIMSHPHNSHSHLTLGPKPISGGGTNNNGYMNTVGLRSTNGFFNSPRVNNRRNLSNNNNLHNNHPSAGVNTISAALSAHNNMNGGCGTQMTLNGGNGSSSGTTNANSLLPTNSFGVSLMKSSSGCSNPTVAAVSASNHHLGGPLGGPLGICGEESNYYAATDIFQVADKHFDRF